jgi:short-subunit dehydrogenase
MNSQVEALIVTGASRGIGEATARHFCKSGFKVIGIARTDEAFCLSRQVLQSKRSKFI